MAVQSYTEKSDFPVQEDGDLLPEGYIEALEDFTALAANLLNEAINGEPINRCWDCSSWIGRRCLKDKIKKIARSEACEEFLPK